MPNSIFSNPIFANSSGWRTRFGLIRRRSFDSSPSGNRLAQASSAGLARRLLSRAVNVIGLPLAVCTFAFSSQASLNRQLAPIHLGQFAKSGVFVGGQSQKNLSLIGLVKQVADRGGETLTLSFGDLQGRPLRGSLGYFHVSLDAKNSRLLISLQNLKKTTIDNHDLAVKVADSIFIGATEMTSDPIDDSVNLTLALRVPVEMKVNAGAASLANQLIIEMRPVVANGEQLIRKAQ